MNAKALAAVAALSLVGPVTAQQPAPDARPDLATLLGTPEHQWVFHHVCVPIRALNGIRYTNAEFVAAWLSVAKARWTTSLNAQARDDRDGSMKAVAPILHSVIDLHWPERVERDASGAITHFRNCSDLGNLQGVLREEADGGGWSGPLRERATIEMAQVIRKWKDGRPFQEVADMLLAGPMRLSEAHANATLGE